MDHKNEQSMKIENQLKTQSSLSLKRKEPTAEELIQIQKDKMGKTPLGKFRDGKPDFKPLYERHKEIMQKHTSVQLQEIVKLR